MSKEFQISLHSGQLRVFNDPHKVRVFLAARRSGKSYLMINELILAALGFPGKTSLQSPERVLCALPTLAQARKIIWEPLVSICEQTAISKYVRNINRTEFKIDFESGKPSIIITGANDRNGDGMRGSRLYFVGLDEMQNMKPGMFDTVVYPALADTVGSRALITGTPMGSKNLLTEMYRRADLYPDTYASFTMKTIDNPTINAKEIEIARRTLPPRLFRQEFEASIETNEFSIYSELDEIENRCDRLPDSFDKVVLGVDFGDVNPSIVAIGVLDNVDYFLDAWNPSSGQVIPQPYFDAKIVELAARWQPVGTFCDPSRPSSILSIRKLGETFGLIGLKKSVAGYNKIAEGNSQVHSKIFQRRLLIPREDITRGRKDHVSGDNFFAEMFSYCYKVDKDGAMTDEVAPAQRDHNVDAYRYTVARKTGT